MKKAPLRYEDAAIPCDVTNPNGNVRRMWMPVKMPTMLFADEHQARYAAADDLPCKCGGRMSKGWLLCEQCLQRVRDRRWAEFMKNAVEWDGKSPVCECFGDKFFFDPDELRDYLADLEEGEEPRLVLAREIRGRAFDMEEWLSDQLPEDHDFHFDAINEFVNAYLESLGPLSWESSKTPIKLDGLRPPKGTGDEQS